MRYAINATVRRTLAGLALRVQEGATPAPPVQRTEANARVETGIAMDTPECRTARRTVSSVRAAVIGHIAQ